MSQSSALKRRHLRLVVASLAGGALLCSWMPTAAADGAAPSAAPAPPAGAGDQAASRKLALVYRLMDAVGTRKVLQSIRDNLGPAMLDAGLKGKPVSPERRQAMIDAVNEAVAAREPAMIDQIARLYVDTFTEEELTQAVAFYESPVGHSMTQKLPLVMSQLGPVIASMTKGLQEDIMAGYCKRIRDCDAASGPAKSAAS